MRDRLIAWLWPALRPLIVALLTEALEQINAEQKAANEAAATQPARRYIGSHRP